MKIQNSLARLDIFSQQNTRKITILGSKNFLCDSAVFFYYFFLMRKVKNWQINNRKFVFF